MADQTRAMPDFVPEDDDDETIPPAYNDTGDFGDCLTNEETDND